MTDRNSLYGDKRWDKKQWIVNNIIRIFRANNYYFERNEVLLMRRSLMCHSPEKLEDICVGLLKFSDLEIVLSLVKNYRK